MLNMMTSTARALTKSVLSDQAVAIGGYSEAAETLWWEGCWGVTPPLPTDSKAGSKVKKKGKDAAGAPPAGALV